VVVKDLIWLGIEPRFLVRPARCLMMQYSGCPNIEVLLRRRAVGWVRTNVKVETCA